MDLEVRHLRTLTTVASLGSITKAAAALGIAQPALSAQLSRIDRALGGPSFVRDHRGVRPTPLGMLVLERARTLLPAMDALLQDARRLARGDTTTTLRLASTDSTLAAALVHRLSRGDAPPPTLRCTSDTARAVSELAAGTHDAVLAGMCGDALPPAAPGVRWQLVATDAVQVVVRADHPCGDVADLAELADERWVVAVDDSCSGECFLRACARVGFAPPPPSECDRAASLDLVETSGAVALAHPYGGLPGTLRGVSLRGTPLSWSTWLALHADCPPDLQTRVVTAARDARRDRLRAVAAARRGPAPETSHRDRAAM